MGAESTPSSPQRVVLRPSTPLASDSRPGTPGSSANRPAGSLAAVASARDGSLPASLRADVAVIRGNSLEEVTSSGRFARGDTVDSDLGPAMAPEEYSDDTGDEGEAGETVFNSAEEALSGRRRVASGSDSTPSTTISSRPSQPTTASTVPRAVAAAAVATLANQPTPYAEPAKDLSDYCRQLVQYINSSGDVELTLDVGWAEVGLRFLVCPLLTPSPFPFFNFATFQNQEVLTLLTFLAELEIEEHQLWVNMNVGESIFRCMERASQFAEAQEWGCAALWNLAQQPENATALLNGGAADTIHAVLCHPQHLTHLGVQVRRAESKGISMFAAACSMPFFFCLFKTLSLQAQCFGALTTFALSPVGQDMLLEAELMETVFDLTVSYSQRYAVSAIKHRLRRIIGGDGLSSILCSDLGILQRKETPRHRDFEWWGSMLLANLADGRGEIIEQLVAKDATEVKPALAALRLFFFSDPVNC